MGSKCYIFSLLCLKYNLGPSGTRKGVYEQADQKVGGLVYESTLTGIVLTSKQTSCPQCMIDNDEVQEKNKK